MTPEGADSGVVPANVVEDELDWHNEFVGQYVLTDVRYVRYVGINNMHCMYWKSSKKFADQGLYHVTDSMCINVPSVLAASQVYTYTMLSLRISMQRNIRRTFSKTFGWLHSVPKSVVSNMLRWHAAKGRAKCLR